jgi:hypothetical protein
MPAPPLARVRAPARVRVRVRVRHPRQRNAADRPPRTEPGCCEDKTDRLKRGVFGAVRRAKRAIDAWFICDVRCIADASTRKERPKPPDFPQWDDTYTYVGRRAVQPADNKSVKCSGNPHAISATISACCTHTTQGCTSAMRRIMLTPLGAALVSLLVFAVLPSRIEQARAPRGIAVLFWL